MAIFNFLGMGMMIGGMLIGLVISKLITSKGDAGAAIRPRQVVYA